MNILEGGKQQSGLNVRALSIKNPAHIFYLLWIVAVHTKFTSAFCGFEKSFRGPIAKIISWVGGDH